MAKNDFEDWFAEKLAQELDTDQYLKCVSLKSNNLSKKGILHIAQALQVHPYLLSFDLRDNPGFSSKSDNNRLMKLIFLRNLREAIAKYHED